jgi:hypothetical protein
MFKIRLSLVKISKWSPPPKPRVGETSFKNRSQKPLNRGLGFPLSMDLAQALSVQRTLPPDRLASPSLSMKKSEIQLSLA